MLVPSRRLSPPCAARASHVLWQRSVRRRDRSAAALAASRVTEGQRLRGHGAQDARQGWKDAGWDLANNTVKQDFRDMVIRYGELAQATYDNLGKNRCDDKTYGETLKAPEDLLAYLTSEYNLDPGAPAATSAGTGERYKLPPATAELSPIIHAKPGKGTGVAPHSAVPPRVPLLVRLLDNLVDSVFATTSGILVTLVAGTAARTLFKINPKTGREIIPRGAFIAYVAVSESAAGEADVAVVWRGTQFLEEWETNFAQNELTAWESSPEKKSADILNRRFSGDNENPDPREIGVHDGFDDLYNRPVKQPKGADRSPRQVVREWLQLLMKERKVTTITVTGHSLGGGMATLSGFGIGEMLNQEWDKWDKKGWTTQDKPKVTVVAFAAPRVGNYTFKSKYREFGVRVLRVCNKGDFVTKVPGIWVQLLSKVLEKLPVVGARADIDMDFWPVQISTWLYYQVTVLCASLLKWKSRWGFFHVGQVLLLDSDKPEQRGPDVSAEELWKKHNLELYLYMLSKLGSGETTRNKLLMNKSDDLLVDKAGKPAYPADWWAAAEVRGYKLINGRWHYKP